ncbi:MAG: hypothetical protein H6721_04830 [Sandaracinus sp.]|nr:hypothetical protein [Sandaracinus sp.]
MLRFFGLRLWSRGAVDDDPLSARDCRPTSPACIAFDLSGWLTFEYPGRAELVETTERTAQRTF